MMLLLLTMTMMRMTMMRMMMMLMLMMMIRFGHWQISKTPTSDKPKKKARAADPVQPKISVRSLMI